MSETNGHVPDDGTIRKLDNGAVLVTVAGQSVLMRPPKVGVLRRLAEAEEDLRLEADRLARQHFEHGQDLAVKVTEVMTARQAKRRKADKPESVSAALWKKSLTALEKDQEAVNAEALALGRELQAWATAARARWFRDAYTASTDSGAPNLPTDDDDLDAWMVSTDTGPALIQHWTSSPLAVAHPGT